jgi:hypothetical protein
MNQFGATPSNRSTVPTTDSADQMIPTRSALTETVPPITDNLYRSKPEGALAQPKPLPTLPRLLPTLAGR